MKKPTETEQIQNDELNRRDFIKRVGYASVVALAAGGLGLALYDSKGPPASQGRKALTGLGDYALKTLAPGQGKIAIVKGTERSKMVAQGVKALGGMEAFIQKGDRVLIKVNAAFATPASLGATTNPEVLAAIAGLCFKAGAAQVVVTDNPINNPDSCFEISGLASAARTTGAKIITPQAGLFAPVSLPGAKLIENWPVMAGVFPGVTKVIVARPVKDHQRAAQRLPSGHQRHHHRALAAAQAHPGGPGRHGEHDDQRPHRWFPLRPEGDRDFGGLH